MMKNIKKKSSNNTNEKKVKLKIYSPFLALDRIMPSIFQNPSSLHKKIILVKKIRHMLLSIVDHFQHMWH
jgi:hypothetical protein